MNCRVCNVQSSAATEPNCEWIVTCIWEAEKQHKSKMTCNLFSTCMNQSMRTVFEAADSHVPSVFFLLKRLVLLDQKLLKNQNSLHLFETSGHTSQWVDVLWPLTGPGTGLPAGTTGGNQVSSPPLAGTQNAPTHTEDRDIWYFEMKLHNLSVFERKYTISQVQLSTEGSFRFRIEISFVTTICGFSLPPTSLPP